MARPDTSLISQFEAQRREAEKNNQFQSNQDYSFLSGLTKEAIDRMGGVVHFLPVSTERDPKGNFQSAGVDQLDGDILEPEFMLDPTKTQNIINLHTQIHPEPEKQLLRKFGIDEQRDVIFFTPFKSLQERPGLVSEWRPFGVDIGDLFFWDGSWYQAWNVHRDSYFGQRDEAFYIAAFCNRYRPNSVPTEDVANEDPVELV